MSPLNKPYFLLKYPAHCVILRFCHLTKNLAKASSELGGFLHREAGRYLMKKQSKRLPKEFYPYFWDVDPAKIDVVQNSRYVIERLLEFGHEVALRWMFERYQRTAIRQVVSRARGLSKLSGNFWALYFGIPKERMRCLNKVHILPNSPFANW